MNSPDKKEPEPSREAGSMQPGSEVRIDVLVFDGFDELDAIGPYEVLRNAFAEVTLTSASGPEAITAAHGPCSRRCVRPLRTVTG
jgi:putative intracellular protease/amidase